MTEILQPGLGYPRRRGAGRGRRRVVAVALATLLGSAGAALPAAGAGAQALPSGVQVEGLGPGGLAVPQLTTSCAGWQVPVVVRVSFPQPTGSFSATVSLGPSASPAAGAHATAHGTAFSGASQAYSGAAVTSWAFVMPMKAAGPVQPGPYTITVHWSSGGTPAVYTGYTQVEPRAASVLAASAQCALAHYLSAAASAASGLKVLSAALAKTGTACAACHPLSSTTAEIGALLAADAGAAGYLADGAPDLNYKVVATPASGSPPAVTSLAHVPTPVTAAASTLVGQLTKQYRLESALATALAREWGAGLAGSTYWSARQAQAVELYAGELASSLAPEAAVVNKLVAGLPAPVLKVVTTKTAAETYQEQAAASALSSAETSVLARLGASPEASQQVAGAEAAVAPAQVTAKGVAQLLGPSFRSAIGDEQTVAQSLVKSEGESGYWVATSSGLVKAVGGAKSYGAPKAAASPVVALVASPDGRGYWLVTKAGAVHAYGSAQSYGPAAGRKLAGPVVGMAITPDGKGYWLATSNGVVYHFGDARALGPTASKPLALPKPVVGIAATSDGGGFWLATSAGQVLNFGDAQRLGPKASAHQPAPVTAMAATTKGQGFWLVTRASAVLAFGDASSYGPRAGHKPAGQVVAMAVTPDSGGYWLVTRAGRVAGYGDAAGASQPSPLHLSHPVAALAVTTVAGPGVFGQGIFNYLLPGVVPDAGHAVGGLLEADGLTWVAEPASDAVAAVSSDGFVRQYPTPSTDSHPISLAAGAGGDIWFTEQDSNQIGLIEPSSGKVLEFALPIKGTQLSGIAVGPDGRAWFVELEAGKIGAISPSGTLTTYSLPMANSVPRDITKGPDGRMWFVQDAGNSIGAITMGGDVTEYAVPTAASHPRHIVAGPDGRLWFTEFGADKVAAITTAGKVTEYPVPTANAGPDGITVGPDGHLWFTEPGAGKIGTVSPATGVVADYPLLGNASQPLGIASGINGTLFISDNLNMSVDAMTISEVEGAAS